MRAIRKGHVSGGAIRAARAGTREPRRCFRWIALRAAILVVLSALFLPQSTRTAESARRGAALARTHHEVAQQALAMHQRPAMRASQARAVRARLIEVRESLIELIRDPTPARAESLLQRRQAATTSFRVLRGGDRRRSNRGPLATIDTALQALWREVDAAAIDPIGQRARATIALERIEEALVQPAESRTLALSASVPEPLQLLE